MGRKAVVVVQSWAGRSVVPVTIVGETKMLWRVRLDADKPRKLAGRNVWRQPGDVFLVPKTAVRLLD
jgi:hypothetical protein